MPNRDWVYQKYPQMILTTKSKDTAFEDLEKEHIQKINDDWTTPLWLFQDFQGANISLNMFFVDSPFMYSYAWCVGVQTVTTSNCRALASVRSNMFMEVCYIYSIYTSPTCVMKWCAIFRYARTGTITMVTPTSFCLVDCLSCWKSLQCELWRGGGGGVSPTGGAVNPTNTRDGGHSCKY